MRVECSARIRADRETLWEYVSDPQRYTEFMVGARFRPVEGEPDRGLRARYNAWLHVGSAEIGGVVEVIQYDQPDDFAWTNITGLDHRGRFRLRSADHLTTVTVRLSFQPPGGILALIASRVAAPLVRRNLNRSLERLKWVVEHRRSRPFREPAGG